MLPDETELEERVDSILRSAKVDPYDCVPPSRIARRLTSIAAIVAVRGLTKPGELVANDIDFSRGIIRVRWGMSEHRREWVIGTELFEYQYRFGLRGVPNESRELVFRRGSARLLVHRSPLRKLHRAYPWEIARLAQVFNTSEIIVGLRIGEVFDIPVAVVGELFPNRAGGPHVWRKGPNWLPSERMLRAIVAAGGLRGFRVIPFTARQLHLVVLEDADAVPRVDDPQELFALLEALRRARLG